MTIGERLKIARETANKTQKEFASIIDASYRALQDYEAGFSVPGGKVIAAYVRLGFDGNWLLTGEGEVYRDSTKSVEITARSSVKDKPVWFDECKLVKDIVEQYELSLHCKITNEDPETKARNIAMIFRYFLDKPERYHDEVDVSIYINDWF
jgi:transcriptional regulator with XRE-family HTH domain